MLVRRFVSVNEYQEALKDPDAGIEFYPLLVSNSRRNRFGQFVDKSIAKLKPLHEMELHIPLPDLSKHGLIAIRSDITYDMAVCYSRATDRPLCLWDTNVLQTGIPVAQWSSATVVLPINLDDPYRRLTKLRQDLRNLLGRLPQIGFLVAEDIEILSWLIFKQLKELEIHTIVDTPRSIVIEQNSESQYTNFPVERFLTNAATADLVTAINKTTGVLIFDGHSRYHCGLVHSKDHLVGVCGSPTRGENGLCFGGKNCFFDQRPKIIMESLSAKHIFYNGCFTLKFADAPYAIPRNANLGLSSLRGSTAQIIGNYGLGHYTEWDVMWFIALSFLDYPPAMAAGLIHHQRQLMGGQEDDSIFFIGDGATSAWNHFDLPLASVTEKSTDEVDVSWIGNSTILVARLNGTKWAYMAHNDMLDVSCVSKNLYEGCRGNLLVDELTNTSILLICIPDRHLDGEPVTLRLKLREESISRDLGSSLAFTLSRAEFLMRCKAFNSDLASLYESSVGLLMDLRRFSVSREDIFDLETRLSIARVVEERAVVNLDRVVVESACARATSGRWNWEEEYASNVLIQVAKDCVVCSLCGNPAYNYDCYDLLDFAVQRRQTLCVECGPIADLPIWPLDVQLEQDTPQWNGTVYQDAVKITNNDRITRVIAVKPGINLYKDYEILAEENEPVFLEPGQSKHIILRLRTLKPISGFYRVRVYIASFGDFGFVARPYVF